MVEQNRFGRFDFPLFWTALALWAIGVLLVFSATHCIEGGRLAGIYKQQIIWVIMAVAVIVAIVSVPGRFFFGFAYVLFGLSVILLLVVAVAGSSAKGAERWILVAGFKFQPSEFAKIGLLLALARWLSEHRISLERPASFIVPSLFAVVPFFLVLKQPDLGTAMVFIAMVIPMLYWAGLRPVELLYLVSPGISLVLAAVPLMMSFAGGKEPGFAATIPWGVFFIVLFAVLYFQRQHLFLFAGVMLANLFTATIVNVAWFSLKSYQKMRFLGFLDPQQDPFGAGYQVIQSKVAIGSGFLFGKGFLKGTQTKLSFLPEQHTDFIFSVLGEQFGLAGCCCIIALFLFLLSRGFYLTQSVRNRFFNLVIVGAVSIITVHVFFNTAMTLGMMPVVGIPLPFLSYGGSFTLTLAILLGLILSAKRAE
jgi:rod shape determining protein RodA